MRTKSAFFRAAALFCAATGVLAFSARAVWGQQATFDVVSRENVMVPMRDGVKLATDVYLPARNGKPIEGRWPTVLSRTPYNKDGSRGSGRYYIGQGYAYVAQDTRGRYKSEGIWHWMTDDRQDGYDAIEISGEESTRGPGPCRFRFPRATTWLCS